MKSSFWKKRVSFLMACMLILEMFPTTLPKAQATDGDCDHHFHAPEVCSYREEVQCTHGHSISECYQLSCTHTACDDSCGYQEPVAPVACDCGAAEGEAHADSCSFEEGISGADCGHQCTVESQCLSAEPTCGHTDDGSCCYQPPQNCDYVCEECQKEPETEPAQTDSSETETEYTEPADTEPEDTEPEDTEPEDTEPEDTKPQETEPEDTTPQETEAEETEPEETEPEGKAVDGSFSINWINTSYSGRVPNVAADVHVLDTEGNEVDAVVSQSGDGYTIHDLHSSEAYSIQLIPGQESMYTLTGETAAELVYDEETEQFVSNTFTAALDTYSLLYNVVWPEGATAPDGFDVALCLDGSALTLQENRTQDGYAFEGLYEVDGDYTLVLPEVEDFITDCYEIAFNSKTAQPLELVYDCEDLEAEFVIYWSDRENRLGYRDLEPMEQMLTLTSSGNVLSGFAIHGEKQESDLDNFEKYVYRVTDLPSGLEDSLELKWDNDALLCYQSLESTGGIKAAADFAPLTLSRETAVFTADEAYIMQLPEYEVTVNVSGLGEDGAERLTAFMNGITIEQMDPMEGTQTPYTGFWLRHNEGVVTIEGLTANVLYNDMGQWISIPGCYTVSWPDTVDGLELLETSDTELFVGRPLVQTFAAGGSAMTFSADVDFGAPSFSAAVHGEATQTKPILWYDTTNAYNHQGQLTLETSITINDRTKDITLTPADWKAGAYIYSFEEAYTKDNNIDVAQFCEDFGITLYPQNKDPIKRSGDEGKLPTYAEVEAWIKGLTLKVEDQGGNELNRTMKASIAGNLKVARTQYQETDPDYITYPVTIGDIEATDVTYTPEDGAEIQKYMIGTSTIDNVTYTVLYPLSHVKFSIEILTGDNSLCSDIFKKLVGYGHIQIKENGEIRDKVLAPIADGKSYLEQELGLIADLGNSYVSGEFNYSTAIGTYTFLLPLYDEKKIQIEYAMSILDESDLNSDDKKVHVTHSSADSCKCITSGDYFRVEYNNTAAPGHGTDLDRAYQGGKTILIRTGETGFTFHKYWVDDGSDATIAARPDATYELWRYPDKPKSTPVPNYESSANIKFPNETGTLVQSMPIPKGESPVTITIPSQLDKYDGEGYPYIYFIRETIPASSGYQKFYGQVGTDGKVISGTDILAVPYAQGASREAGDNSVYNNGNISNVKTDTITTKVTKTWVGAYYQDHFDEVKVTVNLYRKLEGAEDSTKELYKTFELDDFDAYNPTQSAGGTYELYNDAGQKYVYWWEEASAVQYGANNQPVTLETVPAGLAGIPNGDAINAKAGETKQYYLPMNAQTMIADSYSPSSQEYFEVTSTVDEEGTTHFVNTLKGDTEYWIRKTWDQTLTPWNVSFPLMQIDASGSSKQWDNLFTLETKNYPKGNPETTGERTHDSGWHKGYVDLPKYDEDGNLYTYIAREETLEGIRPISEYGKDVHEGGTVGQDGAKEAQSLHVHNAPVGRVPIHLRKIWLDDSANTDRTDVQVQVVANVTHTGADNQPITETVVLYGPEGLYGGYVSLTEATDWIETKDATLYRLNGVYVTKLPDETIPVMPLAEGIETAAANQPEAITVTYTVTEVSLGTGENRVPVDTENKTPAGYPTVKYGDTTYAVFYKNGTAMSPDGVTQADAEQYYTVYNLRIGTVQMGVNKIWKDDGTVQRSDYNASVTLKSIRADRLKRENQKGYAKVHPAVDASCWTPVYGGTVGNPASSDKTHVDLTQTLPTAQTDGEAGQTSYIYYYDLPLYDETGKILQYTVEENSIKKDDQSYYVMSSTPVQYQNSTASQYIGMQTVTNTFTSDAPVEFYLLWLDDYREGIDLRPDMYLKLYYAEYQYKEDGSLVLDNDDQPVYEVKPYSYQEYSWSDATRVTENCWKYSFNGLPQYDEHGRKMSYYATVSSHVDMPQIDYLAPQYSLGKVDSNVIFQSAGINQSSVDPATLAVTHTLSTGNAEAQQVRQANDNAVVLHSENTFVLQLYSHVIVQGRKVWEKIPDGFPVSDLPLLTFKLKRALTAREAAQQTAQERADSVASIFTAEDGYITLSAILDYRSPQRDYTFDMNYMGILTQNADGSFGVVPAATVLDAANQKTALDVWMSLAGIAEANRTKAAAIYGQPLPKYDSYGTMYVYKVIETLVKPNTDGFAGENPGVEIEVLTNSINEYKITNTINLGTRPITATKSWFRFDKSHNYTDEVYPPLEFRLYRFVRVDNDGLKNPETNVDIGPTYTEPILVKTVSLTSAEVEAKAGSDVYAEFGNMEIFAPNGHPYIYVVAEKKIPGYNTGEDHTVTVTNAVQMSKETDVDNWPDFQGDYWYSTPFKLTAGATNSVDTAQAAGTTFDNIYTAMEQIPVYFTKTWDDYGNQLKTRPNSLRVELSRSFTHENGTSTEKIATIAISGSDGKTTVTWESGFATDNPLIGGNETAVVDADENTDEPATGTVYYKNLTSTNDDNRIKVDKAIISDNQWKLTVSNLDKHAPNGSEYRYTWAEPDHLAGYTVTVEDGGLKNTLSKGLRVFKKWEASNGTLNEDIAKPSVTVRLMVSDNDGESWQPAKEYRNGALKSVLGENFDFECVLDYPYWYKWYEKLPTGYDGNALKYKVVEIAVGGQSVGSQGDTDWVYTTLDGWQFGEDNSVTGTSTVTNTLTTTSLTVTKNWVDDNNVFRTRYLNGDGKWEVSYHVYRSIDDSTDITGDEQLVKAFEDRRTENPEPYVLTVTGADSSSITASFTLTGLPTHDAQGNAYTYYAVELNPDRTKKTSAGEPVNNNRYDGTYHVTTTHGGNATNGFTTAVTNDMNHIDLEVTKLWLEDNGFDGVRPGDGTGPFAPDTVKLHLWQYKGSADTVGRDLTTEFSASAGARAENTLYQWTIVEGSDNNQWKILFQNLPKSAPDGTDYIYKVKEDKVPGYQPGIPEDTVVAEDGGQTEQVSNTITKFRIQKLGKNNAGDTAEEVLHNVTLVFEGISETVTAGYKLEWKSVGTAQNYTESYTITKDGNAWSSGSAENKQVDIYGLPEGEYTLTEERVIPEGYYPVAANAKRRFKLETENGVQTLTENAKELETDTSGNLPELEVYNYKTTLKINKNGKVMDGNGQIQSSNSQNLNDNDGWEFKITGRFTDTDTEKTYTAATTDLLIGKLIVNEAYTLTEVKTPDGYTLNSNPIQFKITKANKVEIITPNVSGTVTGGDAFTFHNEPFQVTVRKNATGNGAALSGAEYRLYEIHSNNAPTTVSLNNPEIFTTDSGGKVVIRSYLTNPKLKADNTTRYMLVETKAPDGYIREDVAAPAGYNLPEEISTTAGKTHPWVIFHFDSSGKLVQDSVCQITTLSAATINVNGVSNTSNTVTFSDDPIALTLHKYDGGDEYKTPEELYTKEVKFTIQESGASGGGTELTMRNGTLQLGVEHGYKLTGGKTYTITETRVNGFQQLGSFSFRVNENGSISELSNTTSVTITGAENTDLKIVNSREKGRVTLTKKDSTAAFDLNGAKFELRRADAAINWLDSLKQFITGKNYELVWSTENGSSKAQISTESVAADGKLVISGLPWGEYQLVEVEAPEGYVLPAENDCIHRFTINAETVEAYIPVDYVNVSNAAAKYTFYKQSSAVNGPFLAGAEFQLTQKGQEDVLKTYTTNEIGQFTISSVDSDGTALIQTSTEASKILYTITETRAPLGYELPSPAPSAEFWVDTHGVFKFVQSVGLNFNEKFMDMPIELRLVKYDSGDKLTSSNQIPMANVEFEILNAEGKALAEGINTKFTTGSDGTVQLPVIRNAQGTIVFPVGENTYQLKETKQSGFEQLNNIQFTVTADGNVSDVRFVGDNAKGSVAGSGATLTVKNQRLLGRVTLTKKDTALNVNLNDAIFELRMEEKADTFAEWLESLVTGKSYKVVWTNDTPSAAEDSGQTAGDGQLVITDLPWGSYQLVEIQPPAGYRLPGVGENQPVREFVIDASNSDTRIELDYINNQSFSFDFYKAASNNNTLYLPGAVFTLTDAEGKTLNTYTSDENGLITVKSAELVEGSLKTYLKVTGAEDAANENYTRYRLTETLAPAGYALPNPAPYVEFWVNETGELQLVHKSAAVREDRGDYIFQDAPITLTLNKRDGGDRSQAENFLKGVTFEIRNADGNAFTNLAEGSTAAVVTGNDGTVDLRPVYQMVEGKAVCVFPVGGTTYRLRETTVNGYFGVNEIQFHVNPDGTLSNVKFVGTAEHGSVSVGNGDATEIKVINDRIPGTLKLTKTDMEENPLNGVVFNLYHEEEPATLVDRLMGFVTGKTYTLAASFQWDADATGKITVENGTQAGVLTVLDLDWGSYKLVETYADGYKLDMEEETLRTYTFTIGPEDPEHNITLNAELTITNIPNHLIVNKVEEEKSVLLRGAQYELHRIGENGQTTKITNTTDETQPMWIWDSNTGRGEAFRLRMGRYQLVETRSPYGYVVAEPIVFTMDQKGEVRIENGNCRLETNAQHGVTPVIMAEDQLTRFQFSKVELYNESCSEDAGKTRILPGVTFTAYEDEALTEEIATAVSDENGVVTFLGLPLADYLGSGTSTPVYIREVSTLPGHVLDQNVYKVYVDSEIGSDGKVISNAVLKKDDKDVAENTLINDVYRGDFTFTKVNELDQTLGIPGGEYGLYKTIQLEAGPLKVPYEIHVATAVSDKDGKVTFAGLLMDTEYTVRELSVPTGSYLSANEIRFKLVWNGDHPEQKLLDNGDGTLLAKEEKLLWLEPQVVVSILKTDSSGKPLAGAKLQLRDSDGNAVPVLNHKGKEVTSWISTKRAFEIASQLEAGETYWLYELEAPENYTKGRRVKIKIPDKPIEPGEDLVIKASMKNYHVTESPKTGDDSMVLEAMGMMVFSGAILVSMLLLGGNRRRLALILARKHFKG